MNDNEHSVSTDSLTKLGVFLLFIMCCGLALITGKIFFFILGFIFLSTIF
jgi:hypothetical protein